MVKSVLREDIYPRTNIKRYSTYVTGTSEHDCSNYKISNFVDLIMILKVVDLYMSFNETK